ncbi:Telomeric repeat-binding factor 2 [Corynebacterium atrinae]|uniref:DUF4352 domain-containing protein n=1 Tax=Corynebacterium atrinae TaxID=1336740 RepID=UPI0025B50605|nr:DUF4352 domain-containing protein [Corynebacterium atrinae]WJY62673.1 Telomeric repeat-binding factor 2 [Corynebacterium atrinae]
MTNPQPFHQDQVPNHPQYQAFSVEKPKKKKKWPWVAGIGALLVLFAATSGGDSEDTTTTTAGPAGATQRANSEQTEAKQAVQAAAVPATLQMGDATELGGMQVIISNAHFASDYFSSYVCADVDLTNNSDRAKRFSQFDFELEKPNGVVASTTFTGLDTKDLESAELNPGGNTNGTICFEGDNTSGLYKVIYEGGLFDKPVSWDVTL